MLRDGGKDCPPRRGHQARSVRDRTIVVRKLSVLRQRPSRGEVQVAFDRLIQWTADRGEIGQSDVAQFRHTEAEVAQTKRRIAVFRIEFGQQPSKRARAVAAALPKTKEARSAKRARLTRFWCGSRLGSARHSGL